MSDKVQSETTEAEMIDRRERRKASIFFGSLAGAGFLLWAVAAITWGVTHPGSFLWWSWQ